MKRLDLPRLLRTTAIRISLAYALLYALLAGAALGGFFWSMSQYVDAQLHAGLREDFQHLQRRFQQQGRAGLIALLQARTEGALAEGRFYLLVDASKQKLAGNLTGWPPEDPLPLDGRVQVLWVEDDIIPIPAYDDDAFWPVIGTRLTDGSRLVVARSVEQAESLQVYSLTALLGLLVVIVFLALTMGLLIGWGILKRIDQIRHTASEIMAGDLSKRMPVGRQGNEFDLLSERLNQMLERIEQLLQGIREVTDNVAHDLRGPLTRLRNRLEVTLLEPRESKEYCRVMEQAIEDADRLVLTFNTILQVAQADAGTSRAKPKPMDLSRLVEEMAELYQPLIEEVEMQLQIKTPGPLTILGNRNMLAQALGNLLDNAIKYAGSGGRIRLTTEVIEGRAAVSVEDAGPGISVVDRRRVIERFVRLELARQTPGNGLGLSLVDAIVRQHNAEMVLTDAAPGLIVTLYFSEVSA